MPSARKAGAPRCTNVRSRRKPARVHACIKFADDRNTGRFLDYAVGIHPKAVQFRRGHQGLWNIASREEICTRLGLTEKQWKRVRRLAVECGGAEFIDTAWAGKRAIGFRPQSALLRFLEQAVTNGKLKELAAQRAQLRAQLGAQPTEHARPGAQTTERAQPGAQLRAQPGAQLRAQPNTLSSCCSPGPCSPMATTSPSAAPTTAGSLPDEGATATPVPPEQSGTGVPAEAPTAPETCGHDSGSRHAGQDTTTVISRHDGRNRARLRDVWGSAFAESYPDDMRIAWPRKARGQIGRVLERFDGDVEKAEAFVRWSIENWRVVRRKRLDNLHTAPETPVIGFFLRFLEDFVDAFRRRIDRERSDLLPPEERTVAWLRREGYTEAEITQKVSDRRTVAKHRKEFSVREDRINRKLREIAVVEREQEYAVRWRSIG